MDLNRIAENDTEALARAERFENVDPFPSIPRALLSSAEIADYARATGMLHPFLMAQLKSASYEVFMGGQVISWDGSGHRIDATIERGSPLTLKANSIVFVEVEPIFRLPNYIAIRFNLRITHVHRGLLLGTGPLVDPGFHGKLLIPLHNLTSSDYSIDTSEALIWIEFTKTTFGIEPDEELALRPRDFRGFPKGKRNFKPDQYLRKANGPNPIQSSIPAAIAVSAEAAKNAAISADASLKTTEKLERRLQGLGIAAAVFAVVVTLLTLAGLGYSLYQIGQQFISLAQNSQSLIATIQQGAASDTKAANEKTAQTQEKIDKLSAEYRDQLEKLTSRVNELTVSIQQPKPVAPPIRRKKQGRKGRAR
jgi:deoxycytidine triphosphate deaminase